MTGRAEHELELTFGQVLYDPVDKLNYVFVGWAKNTAGLTAWFHPELRKGRWLVWNAALTNSIERKFPSQIKRKS